MPEPESLRVRANPAVRVSVIESPACRYVGQVCTDSAADAWEARGEADVPNRREYRDAVRDGDLIAANEATAAACGVKFTTAPSAAKEKR